MKKSHVFFIRTLGDRFKEMTAMVVNSLRKFHPDDPLVIVRTEDLKRLDPSLNLNVHVKGLDTFIPLVAKDLIKDYELVISLDIDQIIMGDFNYLIDHRHEYDLGLVENLNRIDQLKFELVRLQGIPPEEYYNIGLVALTNEEVIDHIYALCRSKYKDRFKYKDQDMFNLVAHYGNYRVKNFDAYDRENNYCAWHGLKAKGEGVRMYYKDGQVILPANPSNNYPERDTIIKSVHWAGGDVEKKMNYHVYFNDDMCRYIDWLISDTEEPYKL